ncbi:AbfB domain-containing protein [Actinoplanes sp. KI2]|uniref:AbfB domain-containing protein n=1 Tax=Actinoplanes sp. KI2 TaxID=2983315 RepID=UPI0021D5F119|nr:AbfB domain-containing protein [Actinoplanes sp. KI2]MCU7726824.1 AbfB domain-containing protein [Actinoplanes sp. KI2]
MPVVSSILRSARAHPIAIVLTVGALGLGFGLCAAGWTASTSGPAPNGPPPPRYGSGRPMPPGPQWMLGPASLESAEVSGRFVGASGGLGALVAVGPSSSVATRRAATFVVVSGLADAECFSFRAADGRYLRRSAQRLRLSAAERNDQFRSDATLCARRGVLPESIALEFFGQPGSFVRHDGDLICAGPLDASGAFMVRRPLA